ncbi:MAG: hypothetical protein HW399_179 [Dehalococcoidia bacterium]|nr:hypothetical protein [Dehalococcoidia bacterium]
MDKTQAKAEVYVMALNSLSKKERGLVITCLMENKTLRTEVEGILDSALIRQRRGEPSLPFREYLAKKHLVAGMTGGYKAMGKEQKQSAAMAAKVAPEVLPEWK